MTNKLADPCTRDTDFFPAACQCRRCKKDRLVAMLNHRDELDYNILRLLSELGLLATHPTTRVMQ